MLALALSAALLAGVSGDGAGHEWERWLAQEETGVPLIPFAGLEGGPMFALMPEEWGLDDERQAGWFGSYLMGGMHWDGLFDIHLRFSVRQWDAVDIQQVEGVDVETDEEARVRGAFALLSVVRGFGMIRIGATIGGGLYELKHEFERDVAPSGEFGVFVRIQPVPIFFIEAGALGSGVHTAFNNRDEHETEFLYAGYASAGVCVRF